MQKEGGKKERWEEKEKEEGTCLVSIIYKDMQLIQELQSFTRSEIDHFDRSSFYRSSLLVFLNLVTKGFFPLSTKYFRI